MIHIDGSQGEGGGQILRSALGLSLVTGKPVKLTRIRKKRSRPGLRRQHLVALLAAQQIGQAEVTGAFLGSLTVKFQPRTVDPGNYTFNIDSSGSTTLVAQTVLPALMTADAPSRLQLQGGTHNPMAPTVDFLKSSFLPILNRMGPAINIKQKVYGFCLSGKTSLTVDPVAQLNGLDLSLTGALKSRSVTVLLSELPMHIAERERGEYCRLSGWGENEISVEVIESGGPGNVMIARLEYENVTAMMTEFGALRIPAEEVAGRLWQAVSSYQSSQVPVGPHLADQLMLPMGLAAMNGEESRFVTCSLTNHTITHRDVLRKFLDVEIEFNEVGNDNIEVVIS